MSPVLRVVPVAAALLLFSQARAGQACGAPETPYLTLASSLPSDGAAGVATDAPILIRGTAWPSVASDTTTATLQQALRVEVRAEGKTALVEGQSSGYFGQVAWNPAAPLDPSTSYRVTLHLENQPAPVPGATGPLDQKFGFTTGGAKLAPLALTGAVTYAFATQQVSYCPAEKSNDCGGCSEALTRPGLVALVTPPAIEGGAAEGGYLVMAWLESGAGVPAGTVHLGNALLPGAPSSAIVLSVPTEGTPYEPCFHLEVTDATGASVKSEVTCFPRETIADSAGGAGVAGGESLGGAGGSDSPGTGPQAGAASSAAGQAPSGCSTGGRRAGGGAGLTALAALALLGRRRRHPAGR